MKKVASVLAVLLFAFAIIACGSTPAKAPERTIPSGFPAFVRDAIRNAPEDVLVGIGMANMATPSQSMTISETRARADLSRQMNTMIQDMVRDYQASSEVDHSAALAFQENITVALSQSRLQGSTRADQDIVDGTVWTVMYLGKNNVAQEINQAQAAAKLAVPAMASFNAEARMNAAFEKINSMDPVGRDH